MNTIQNNDRLWSVYMHISPSNKVYIGIAKDIKHRWRGGGNGYKGSTRIWCAIQKYGWESFKHEILATNLTRQQACDMEVELIRKYNSTNPDFGYNLESGGQSFVHSKESIEKLRKSQMGHPVSEKVRKIISEANGKPIICIETKVIFESAKQAADKMKLCSSSVSKAAAGKQDNCGGFHFAFWEDYNNGEIKKFIPSPFKYNRVRCITTGEEYENVSEASRKTGLSRRAISYACNGVHKTCGKNRWEFIKESEKNNVQKDTERG